MKRLNYTLLTILLAGNFLASACKKVIVGKSKGGGSTGAAAAIPGEESPDASAASLTEAADSDLGEVGEETAAEPTNEERFNMVKYIRSKPKLEAYHKYTDEAGTQFSMGDQKFFKIECNGTFGLSPDFAKAEAERKIMGAFWMKAYAANKLLTNAANTTGLFIDMGAEATLDKINIEMHFRYVGVDIASKSILAGFDQSFMRDFEIDANFVPVVKASAKLGGEIGMKGEFGIRRDNVLNLLYTPRANVLGGIQVGVDIVVAGVYLVGETKLINLAMKGTGNIGIVKDSGLLYADIGLDQNDLKLVEGKIDIVTNLFKHEVRRDKVWHPDPLAVMKLPTFASTIVKFFKKPANAGACKVAVSGAAVKLAGNLKKMEEYLAAAAEEDKFLVKSEIKRMGLIYKQTQAQCGPG